MKKMDSVLEMRRLHRYVADAMDTLEAIVRDMRIIAIEFPCTVTAGDLLSFADRIDAVVTKTNVNGTTKEHNMKTLLVMLFAAMATVGCGDETLSSPTGPSGRPWTAGEILRADESGGDFGLCVESPIPCPIPGDVHHPPYPPGNPDAHDHKP